MRRQSIDKGTLHTFLKVIRADHFEVWIIDREKNAKKIDVW